MCLCVSNVVLDVLVILSWSKEILQSFLKKKNPRQKSKDNLKNDQNIAQGATDPYIECLDTAAKSIKRRCVYCDGNFSTVKSSLS